MMSVGRRISQETTWGCFNFHTHVLSRLRICGHKEPPFGNRTVYLLKQTEADSATEKVVAILKRVL